MFNGKIIAGKGRLNLYNDGFELIYDNKLPMPAMIDSVKLLIYH